MVESSINLDNIFGALADQTRRDILRRVAEASLSISDLAQSYQMSFAAIAKHITVLERANLISKKREGKQQIITAVPSTITIAEEHIQRYAEMLDSRFNTLEALLNKQ